MERQYCGRANRERKGNTGEENDLLIETQQVCATEYIEKDGGEEEERRENERFWQVLEITQRRRPASTCASTLIDRCD